MTTIKADSKVYVPSVSNKVLSVEEINGKVVGLKSNIYIAYDENKRYTDVFFTKNGFCINEFGKRLGKVAFVVTEENQAILSELYGVEFEDALVAKVNENKLIKEMLECSDYVPCVFSNTIKNEELTKDNCDVVGYVKYMPNASTDYKYVNIANGGAYKYANLMELV